MRKKIDTCYVNNMAYRFRFEILEEWFPEGRFVQKGHGLTSDHFIAFSPMAKGQVRQFIRINMSDLSWYDHQTDEVGFSLVELVAYLLSASKEEAALFIAKKIGVEELAYV